MGLKRESGSSESWAFSIITQVIMVKRLMTSKDTHRPHTGENQIPFSGSVTPSRVLEAD